MKTKVVLIDNYDSFAYNLVHYLNELNCEVTVFRNDKFKIEDLEEFDKILLSPGPGIPGEAGLLKDVIAHYKTSKSIMGVCLGHQAIAEVFGGQLINLTQVYHGIASYISVKEKEGVFQGLEDRIQVGRYHSWVVDPDSIPELEITAVDDLNYVMAFRHQSFNIVGVQFHPESVLTPTGKQMLSNWLSL